jgi:hypothetical protein
MQSNRFNIELRKTLNAIELTFKIATTLDGTGLCGISNLNKSINQFLLGFMIATSCKSDTKMDDACKWSITELKTFVTANYIPYCTMTSTISF